MEKNKTSVLFVCLGNICRSPMAETIFQKLVEDKGLQNRFRIDSAGMINYHKGKPADARMRKYANERGYNITHLSRPVVRKDFENFDYIIGMDYQNLDSLMLLTNNKEEKEKLSLMTEYLQKLEADVVPDPYYGEQEDFMYVIDLLEDACSGLLAYLTKRA